MKWLIQTVKIEIDKINSLLRILKSVNICYDIVYPYRNEVLTSDKKPYVFNSTEQYFVLGSYPLTKNMYKICPTSVFSLEQYSFASWFEIFGRENMLNSQAVMVRAGEINWVEEELFVRPINDTKDFNGGAIIATL